MLRERIIQLELDANISWNEEKMVIGVPFIKYSQNYLPVSVPLNTKRILNLKNIIITLRESECICSERERERERERE